MNAFPRGRRSIDYAPRFVHDPLQLRDVKEIKIYAPPTTPSSLHTARRILILSQLEAIDAGAITEDHNLPAATCLD